MSCHILERGMEEFIVNTIFKLAKEYGYQKVIGEYLKTRWLRIYMKKWDSGH